MKKEEHKKVTLQYFRDAALEKSGFYDAEDATDLKHSVWQERARRHIKNRVDALARSSMTVLDTGCGNGDFTAALAQAYPEMQFVGRDLSSEMVAVAQENHSDGRNVRYETADLLSPTGSEAFDLVLCINMFHHVHPDDIDRGLDALAAYTAKHLIIEIKNENNFWNRTMRPTGHFPVTLVSPKRLKEYLGRKGLRFQAQWNIFLFDFLSPIVILEFER